MNLKIFALAALITMPANASEMLEPGKVYCDGYGWSYKGLKCADVAASAKAAASMVKSNERKAKRSATEDEAQMYRNKAAFHKAEAERLAAKWHRKYGKKD